MIEFAEMLKHANLKGKERILDLGCGAGLQTLLLGRLVQEVIGIDINKHSIAKARYLGHLLAKRINASFVESKLENAGFRENEFDLMFSICVLEHISNYQEVLTHIRRVLKPGGKLIISVDALESISDSSLIEKHSREHYVHHYFSRDELRGLLASVGFVDITVKPLFQSALSKQLFVKGIQNKFTFGYLRSLLLRHRIIQMEEEIREDVPAIFLLASAIKPVT